jgi:hypothetical protein
MNGSTQTAGSQYHRDKTRRKTGRFAVTNARFATLHGLPVGPFPLSTTPVPLRKNRALVTSDIRSANRTSGGFRLRLGARRCASASLLYTLLSACAPLPASRPPTEAQQFSTHLSFNSHFAEPMSHSLILSPFPSSSRSIFLSMFSHVLPSTYSGFNSPPY